MELRTSRLVAWLRSVQVLGWLTSGWLGEYFGWSISELGPRFVEIFERTAGLLVGRTGLKGALIVAALAEVTRSLPDSFPAPAEVPLLFFDNCWWGSSDLSPCKEYHISWLPINVCAQSRSKYGTEGLLIIQAYHSIIRLVGTSNQTLHRWSCNLFLPVRRHGFFRIGLLESRRRRRCLHTLLPRGRPTPTPFGFQFWCLFPAASNSSKCLSSSRSGSSTRC